VRVTPHDWSLPQYHPISRYLNTPTHTGQLGRPAGTVPNDTGRARCEQLFEANLASQEPREGTQVANARLVAAKVRLQVGMQVTLQKGSSLA